MFLKQLVNWDFFCLILKGFGRRVRSSALKPVPSLKRPPQRADLSPEEPLWDVVGWRMGSMDALLLLLSNMLQLSDAVTSLGTVCPTHS